MKKNNPTYTNAFLLILLLIAAVLIIRLASHAGASPSPMTVKYISHVRPAPVDNEPALRVYDMDKLKAGNEPLNASDRMKAARADMIQAKEWRDADPVVKKEMIDELETNIANSKKALEINPNDTMAKRILLVSERLKVTEKEKFEGKYPDRDVKIDN